MSAKLLSYAEKQFRPVVASVHFTDPGDVIELTPRPLAIRERKLAW